MSTDYYYDLGTHAYPVSTTSPEAQLWFNRGIRWAYSFNHEEAVRCFTKATEHDPKCGMAYWGIAYARGPNYNKAWIRFDRSDLESTFKLATDALATASSLEQHATPLEFALIKALRHRFPADADAAPPENLNELDIAYADAMRPVYQAYPSDLEVIALFVESLMCVSPRQLWDLDTGKPLHCAAEARAALEPAMATPEGQNHPAFCHLYIHLMEMSLFPEVAQPAADRLRQLVPEGSHMCHMATHIDAACGDYRKVIESNHQAMLADNKYFADEKAANGATLYRMYRIHTIMVKCYGGIMAGQSKAAFSAARFIGEIATPEFLAIKSPPMADWAESHVGVIAHALIRFGRWEEILALELPEDQELYCSTTTMIHYAKGVALAALGRIHEAEAAQAQFEAARAKVPRSRLDALPVVEQEVLKVAKAMLEGEISYRKGNFEAAFNSLREAVALEDALPYSDPPAWKQPSRHALGALLLEQGRTEEAEEVFRDDLGFGRLSRRRARINNVWSLHGLHECLERNGKHDQARMLRIQRDIAMASADVPIRASCFCRISALQNGCGFGTNGESGEHRVIAKPLVVG